MSNTDVINPRRFQLLRTTISRGENIVALIILASLAVVIAWVASTRDNYDPAFRDIAPELLAKSEAEKSLYVPPLKRLASDTTSAPASSGVLALGPFPGTIVSEGWAIASRVRQFDADTLFEKINGEAPKFTKQGFQSLHYVVLASTATKEEIGIELFDQGDKGGSLGIFSDHQSANSTVESADGVTFFRTSIGAIGRRGQYFFRIIGDADTETVQAKAIQIATAMSSLQAGQEDVPAGMALLANGMNIDPQLISFQKANVFKFDFASDFWFGKISSDANARLFAHEAKSAEAASTLRTKLLDDLGFDLEMVTEAEDHSILLHGFLKNYFALGVSDNWVFGIENAKSQDDATQAIAQFIEILNGEN